MLFFALGGPLGGLLWVVFGRLGAVWGRVGLSRGRLAALLTALGPLARPRRGVQEARKAWGTPCKASRGPEKRQIPGVRFSGGGGGVPPPRIVKK